MGLGSEIRDPEKNLFRIPGSKMHQIPDPGSTSATLVEGISNTAPIPSHVTTACWKYLKVPILFFLQHLFFYPCLILMIAQQPDFWLCGFVIIQDTVTLQALLKNCHDISYLHFCLAGSILVAADIEPTFLALGPFHLALGMWRLSCHFLSLFRIRIQSG